MGEGAATKELIFDAFVEMTSTLGYENVNNADYVRHVLEHGIEAGGVDPDFDKEIFADALIGAMQIMGIRAFAKPSYVVTQLDEEKRILALQTRLLSTALIY